MIEKIKSKIRDVNHGILHDSRRDVLTLANQVNMLTDKINELIDEINSIKEVKR